MTIGNSLANRLGNRLGFSCNGSSGSLLLDALATAPNALYCFGARLRTAYTGSLFRVRRASDNAELDIGYVAATNLADVAALTAHCSGTNGFVSSIYDQSGNARTLTNATTTQQFKIYDSATGPVRVNGSLCAISADVDDNLQRVDSCGITGTGGKSMAWCGRPDAAGAGVLNQFGNNGAAGQAWQSVAQASATQIALGIGSANRVFTSADYTTSMQRLVGRLQASGTAGQLRLRQNGVELSELSSINPSQASNMASSTTFFGRNTTGVVGKQCAFALWAADISDADAALWNTTMQTLYG